jgi:hypothetical protein
LNCTLVDNTILKIKKTSYHTFFRIKFTVLF